MSDTTPVSVPDDNFEIVTEEDVTELETSDGPQTENGVSL